MYFPKYCCTPLHLHLFQPLLQPPSLLPDDCAEQVVSIPEIKMLATFLRNTTYPQFKIPQIPLERSCLLPPWVIDGKPWVDRRRVIYGKALLVRVARIDHVWIPRVSISPSQACQVNWMINHLASFGGFRQEWLQQKRHPQLKINSQSKLGTLRNHVGHHNVVSTLCEGSETLAEWKSESMTYKLTYGLTGVGTC